MDVVRSRTTVDHKVSREALHPPWDSRDITDRQWVKSGKLSHEMEEFLDELGIKHKRTIPLLLRANGEVERHSSGIPLLVMLLPNVNLHKVT